MTGISAHSSVSALRQLNAVFACASSSSSTFQCPTDCMIPSTRLSAKTSKCSGVQQASARVNYATSLTNILCLAFTFCISLMCAFCRVMAACVCCQEIPMRQAIPLTNGHNRCVLYLGSDHAEATLCLPGECPHYSMMELSNASFHTMQCTGNQVEGPAVKQQASQEAMGQLTSYPSLPATQRSAPSCPPVSFVGLTAASAGPPLSDLCFDSSEDAFSLKSSDRECLTFDSTITPESCPSPPRPVGFRSQGCPLQLSSTRETYIGGDTLLKKFSCRNV